MVIRKSEMNMLKILKTRNEFQNGIGKDISE
jgi:hypothetical protein